MIDELERVQEAASEGVDPAALEGGEKDVAGDGAGLAVPGADPTADTNQTPAEALDGATAEDTKE